RFVIRPQPSARPPLRENAAAGLEKCRTREKNDQAEGHDTSERMLHRRDSISTSVAFNLSLGLRRFRSEQLRLSSPLTTKFKLPGTTNRPSRVPRRGPAEVTRATPPWAAAPESLAQV